MVNKIKGVLFLSAFAVIILTIVYIVLVSASVIMSNPTNGTNGQNFTGKNIVFRDFV